MGEELEDDMICAPCTFKCWTDSLGSGVLKKGGGMIRGENKGRTASRKT